MENTDSKIKRTQYLNVVNLLVGIWLLFAAYVFHGTAPSLWNDVIVGLLVITLAAWNIVIPEAHWASWTNVALGAWLLIAPITIQYPVLGHLWNDVIMGVILITFGSWAGAIRTTPKPMHMPH